MALVVAVTVPSSDPTCVRLRTQIGDLAGSFPPAPWRAGLAVVHHSVVPMGASPSSTLYVGFGLIDCQGRPSPFANPFAFFLKPDLALLRFRQYLYCMPYLDAFLQPLAGATCVCDCNSIEHCHAAVLVDVVNKRSAWQRAPGVTLVPRSPCESVVDADLDDVIAGRADPLDVELIDEGSDGDWLDASSGRTLPSSEDLRCVDETSRGRAIPVARGPEWPKAWTHLVLVVRACQFSRM